MLVCLALCTFILHCSGNATQQFVSRLHSFLLGEENKGVGSHVASYTVCTFECMLHTQAEYLHSFATNWGGETAISISV